jgi:hypothetical protein
MKERTVSPEEQYETPDKKILTAMRACISDIREIIHHTVTVIDQTKMIVREFDDHWPTPVAAWSPILLPLPCCHSCCHDLGGEARRTTAKDELRALVAECLVENNMDTYRAMEEFKKIVSKRPDLLEEVEQQFDHVLLVNPDLLSINDAPDKLPQA